MDFRSRLCSQVLPSRFDWEGNVHEQTFEELVSMAHRHGDRQRSRRERGAFDSPPRNASSMGGLGPQGGSMK